MRSAVILENIMIAHTSSTFAFQIIKLLKTYATIILLYTIFATTKARIMQVEQNSFKNNISRSDGTNSTEITPINFNESKNHLALNNSKKLNNDTILQMTKKVILYCQEKPKFSLDRGVLLTFLLRLKLCQLVTGNSWFDEECAKPLYDLTDYHKMSYDKVCHPFKFAFQCKLTDNNQNRLSSTILKSWLHHRNITTRILNETKQIGKINVDNTTANLTRSEKLTCQSIESYFDVLSEHVLQEDFINFTESSFIPFYNVQYTEWFFIYRVFCKNVACGVSAKNYAKSSITFRDCIPDSCRFVIVGTMVFDGVITLITVAANILILTIFFRTSIMNNIPGYFKLSLALADLGVGIIIMPSIVYNRYRKTQTPLPYRNDTMRISLNNYFSQNYLNAIGFFWIFFVFVSLYTLCAASVDRYLAIARPFRYNKGKYFTKYRTAVVLLLVWLIGAAWAVVLFLIDSSYESLGDDLIIAKNRILLLLYGLCVGIPMIIVWIFNVGLVLNVRAQNRKRIAFDKSCSKIFHYTADQKNQSINCVQMSTDTSANIDNGVQSCDGANSGHTWTM